MSEIELTELYGRSVHNDIIEVSSGKGTNIQMYTAEIESFEMYPRKTEVLEGRAVMKICFDFFKVGFGIREVCGTGVAEGNRRFVTAGNGTRLYCEHTEKTIRKG